MKNLLVIVLASVMFAYYFVNIAGIPQWFKRKFKMGWNARLKPFDCVTCFSVWLAVAFFFTPVIIVKFIAITFTAGYAGYKLK